MWLCRRCRLKFGKRLQAGAMLAVYGVALLRGELADWIQHTPAGPALSALFRTVAMPGGDAQVLRPPAEARRALDALIAGSPRDAMLYRLRAQEAELALDFVAAETDWKAYAERASDTYAADIELADFYHRRLRPLDEVAALMAASKTSDDPLEPANAQRGWHAFERMASLAASEALPDAEAEPIFRAWIARYPKEPEAWRKRIGDLIGRKRFAEAETEIAAYAAAFHDDNEALQLRADVALRRGDANAALTLYDLAFQPLWPPEMLSAYFHLLEQQGRLREFTGRARSTLASNPADLDAAARLFQYFRHVENPAAARRALVEYRLAKESGRQPWTAAELETLAQLFELLPDAGEAARLYYALYNAPPTAGPHVERALYGLANLLLTNPQQPILFGSGDLSFYKDIATVDVSPGFLNGILSLVLNETGVRGEYQQENDRAAPYFHRAAAAGLVALLDRRFPQSAHRDELHAALVSAYGAYGDDESVTRTGREYLRDFPAGASRVSVALQVSDALARAGNTAEEFALYHQLLRELSAKASGVPIGRSAPEPLAPVSGAAVPDNPDRPAPPQPNAAAGVRSPDYVRVLDKYLSRLAEMQRAVDALRVYREEIDRNPNDPGLYERLAAWLEENGASRDVEETYARAIAKFADTSWRDKLARWYLRKEQWAALAKLTREVIGVFSGSELERYFAGVVSPHPDAAMYVQLNIYAHERFPEDLVFVNNLLGAYDRQPTRNAAAAERLLRQYWFYDRQMATRLFHMLAQEGRLATELAQIRAANPALAQRQYDRAVAANPAAVQFLVEAEDWQSHFEAAAPAARALAAAYPGRREFTEKAESLYRSLAAYNPRDTDVALTMAGYEQRANPGDPNILARMGDICADRELFARAVPYWERMPAAQPSRPDAYLDTATVYWDYYRYDDALRWIAAARKKFNQPTLFAYQGGAIDENKRNYAAAVKEYTEGALAGEADARGRLLRLLQRANLAPLIDRATEAAVAANPTEAAVTLRVDVLEALNRRGDLEALLRTRIEAARAAADLTMLEETARRLGSEDLELRANERLSGVTNDPIDKMRLTLANVRLLESKKDIAQAARVVDALYRDHPLILGVVRGAVDFHVRNHQPDQAEGLLIESARRARPGLATGFTLEAARIATEAGEFARARTLLAGLLAADPLRAEYLSAVADTYLRANDDRGFSDFELATIELLKKSSLPAAERIERIAAMRRALIPALDRMKDTAGAVDQYIEIVNRYPEDQALTKEAASYAVTHGQAARLVAFYRKTVNDAPLDYRWPIVLGRIETVTEDYPSAIADYERGFKARPDRADVLQAKAHLEERIMRFDDAIASYARLYELAYHDPQWLIKVAELRARTGKNAEAITALKTAMIGARTETAEADFEIASLLERWHILPAAADVAERGAKLAGDGLFDAFPNALLYARVTTEARRLGDLLDRLGSHAQVDPQMEVAAAKIIAATYTPEEKVALDRDLENRARALGPKVRDTLLLPLVQAAGLAEIEARWRYEALMAQNQSIDPRFVSLQAQRGLFAELAHQLETYAAANPGKIVEAGALTQAAEACIAEGDHDCEMRDLRTVFARDGLSGVLLDRYLSALAAGRPDDLLAAARANPSSSVRNRAVQIAIADDRRELAYSAVRARGSTLPPVWTNAYLALAGLYFGDHSTPVDSAFQTALDTRTIGERLQTKLKPDSVIVGTVWFYYGARYGDFLAAAKNSAAPHWLPSSLEAAPGNPEAYMALGNQYAAAGDSAKAIGQYELALELDPDRGDAEDRIARVLWPQNRPEARAHWKNAITIFLRIQDAGTRVPDSFWNHLGGAITAIGERHALDPLRAEIAHLIEDYYQRNNDYRLHEIIEPAVQASIASGVGADWLVQLGRSMNAPEMMLRTLLQARGWTEAQRIALERDLVAVLTKQIEGQFGDNREAAEMRATEARLALVTMLLDAADIRAADAEWALLPPARPRRNYWDQDTARETTGIRLAAKTGTLGALLARYRANPEMAPAENSLRNAAQILEKAGDQESARSVLEFLYDRGLAAGQLTTPNFLGLAEVKLQRNDTAAALALLNRMALVLDDGFETLFPAAELLATYGKSAESEGIFHRRIQAAPWDAQARLELARSLPPASPERATLVATVVADSLAPYELRAQATRLAGSAIAEPGSELALLAFPHISPEAAAKPYQVEARIEAARQSADPQVQLRVWREALAIDPLEPRARIGALRAAIALRRDSLALALDRSRPQPQYGTPQRSELSGDERAALDESLAAAAERLDDLGAAVNYLHQAQVMRSGAQHDALQRRIDTLQAEIARRARNAARQPMIRESIEQGQIVAPRIPESRP